MHIAIQFTNLEDFHPLNLFGAPITRQIIHALVPPTGLRVLVGKPAGDETACVKSP